MISYCPDLFKAIENGDVPLVEKLLAAGIDIEARYKYYGKIYINNCVDCIFAIFLFKEKQVLSRLLQKVTPIWLKH